LVIDARAFITAGSLRRLGGIIGMPGHAIESAWYLFYGRANKALLTVMTCMIAAFVRRPYFLQQNSSDFERK
jgi:hypothetical protein